MNSVTRHTIKELHQQLVKKERSAVEITQETLERVTTLEPKIKAFFVNRSNIR